VPTSTTSTDDVVRVGGLPVRTVEQSTKWIKAIIFGAPFAGKTWLAGSAADVPEMGPVLVIDMEAGTKTLAEAKFKCDVIVVKNKVNKQGQVIRLAWEVLQGVYEDLTKYPPGQMPWKTIVLDNMSEAYALALQHSIEESVAAAAARGRERDEDIAEPKDYASAESKFRKMIRAFRDLDCNVFFTAWDREKTKERNGEQVTDQILPSLAGKLERQVNGYFDEAWYIYIKDGERKLLTRERSKIKAKTRTNAMPDVITAPTMKVIHGYVVGKPTTTSTPTTKKTEGK
jgi:hypothetical protein